MVNQHWFITSKRAHEYYRNVSNKILEKNEILNICSKYPYYSIRKLTTIVNESINKKWSFSTMYRSKRFDVFKSLSNWKWKGSTNYRKLFSNSFSNIDTTKLLCVDETSIYSVINYQKARTKKYTRLHLSYQRTVSDKKTLIVCLANDKIIHYD